MTATIAKDVTSFARAKELPPYGENNFPAEIVEGWLEELRVQTVDATKCASRLAQAANRYAAHHTILRGGPTPTDINTAFAKIDRGATEIADGFATLIRAGLRHGQLDSEYGELARLSAEHLGQIFIGQLVDLFPDRALQENPDLALLAPSFATREGRITVRNALSPAFFRLGEHARMLADQAFPPSVFADPQAEAEFVCAIAEIWKSEAKRPASVTRNALYRSRFHSFVASVFGHLAGLRAKTWLFEYEERERELSAQGVDAATIANDETLHSLRLLIRDAEQSTIPSAQSIGRWLKGAKLGTNAAR